MSSDPTKRHDELRLEAERLLNADYYAALGVARTAAPDQIKNAFLEAAKRWHPDRVPEGGEALRPLFTRLFGRLDLARATLSDPARRARYAEELSKPVTSATPDDVSAAEATLAFQKAQFLLKRNDVAGAEAHLRRAVELAPSNTDSHVLLIQIQATPNATEQRLRALLAELDRLLVRAPTSERAFHCRGQLRKRLGLLREAHADFTRAAELNRHNVDALREIRLYNMRQDKAKQESAPKADGGVDVRGFFRRLLKR